MAVFRLQALLGSQMTLAFYLHGFVAVVFVGVIIDFFTAGRRRKSENLDRWWEQK